MPGVKSQTLTLKSSVLKNILMIFFLVCFSLLHKVNNYSFALFGSTLAFYMLTWMAVLWLIWVSGKLLSRGRSDHIGSVVFIGLFTLNFGDIQDWMLRIFKSKLPASTWTLFICFILLLILGNFLWKKRSFVRSRSYHFFLLLFFILTLVELPGLFKKDNKNYFSKYISVQPRYFTQPLAQNKKPSVFFIVFDSYTSNKNLQQFWNYSNDSLCSFLEHYKFKVTSHSSSLYDFTPLSINSTLNMSYLKGADSVRHDFINFNYGRKAFDTALVPNWFRQQGYAIHNGTILSRDWDLDRFYPFAPDEPLHWLRRQTIERIWLDPFMWNRLLGLVGASRNPPSKVISALNELDRYNKILFDSVKVFAGRHEPQFVYVHFGIPHEPYIYLKDGSKRPPTRVLPNQEKEFYLQQVEYVNSLIRETVPLLLGEDRENRIIIIQGDHGFRSWLPREKGDNLGIFNAAYFPDGDYRNFNDSILSVNTFNIILNQYFNQYLPVIR